MNHSPKPTTEVLLKLKEKKSIEEVANLLTDLADKLKTDQKIVFAKNEGEVEVKPNAEVTLELEYTKKGTKHQFEIEIEWVEGEQSSKITML